MPNSNLLYHFFFHFQVSLSNVNVYGEMVINDRYRKYNHLNKGTRIRYSCEEGSCQTIKVN